MSTDSRTASASLWLVVQAGRRLPIITLSSLSRPKVIPADKLTLVAAVTSAYPATLTTRWSVVSPPEYADYLDRLGVAGTPLSSTSLVILAGQLPPETTLLFRLTATDFGGATSSEVLVPVAGTPRGDNGSPRGVISVTPTEGSGMVTPFTVSTTGWTDAKLPLMYSFAFVVAGPSGGTAAGEATAAAVSIRDFNPDAAARGVFLPAGDSEGGDIVNVIAYVQNGACPSLFCSIARLFLRQQQAPPALLYSLRHHSLQREPSGVCPASMVQLTLAISLYPNRGSFRCDRHVGSVSGPGDVAAGAACGPVRPGHLRGRTAAESRGAAVQRRFGRGGQHRLRHLIPTQRWVSCPAAATRSAAGGQRRWRRIVGRLRIARAACRAAIAAPGRCGRGGRRLRAQHDRPRIPRRRRCERGRGPG